MQRVNERPHQTHQARNLKIEVGFYQKFLEF